MLLASRRCLRLLVLVLVTILFSMWTACFQALSRGRRDLNTGCCCIDPKALTWQLSAISFAICSRTAGARDGHSFQPCV